MRSRGSTASHGCHTRPGQGNNQHRAASGAEKAATAKPEVLGPEAYGKAGRGCIGRTTATRQGQIGEHKPEVLASAARMRKKEPNWPP